MNRFCRYLMAVAMLLSGIVAGAFVRGNTMDNGDYTHSAYMPDGTLKSRQFCTKTVRTVIKVTADGDTIVKTTPYNKIVTHSFMGQFEKSPEGLIYHSTAGHYDFARHQHYWYLLDRLGSTAAVVDSNGTLLQTTAYYPSGTPHQLAASAIATPVDAATDRLHIGNRWLSHSGLNWYDNTARMHDPLLMHFAVPDPLWADYPGLSPWSHCAANPLNLVDPNGQYTKVVADGCNGYTVVGGELDNDKNIYLYSKDKNGEYTVRGESIGVTPSVTTFYDSDKNEWAKKARINPNDQSGIKFLKHITEDTPSLIEYIPNARSGHKYDFKVTNGTDHKISGIKSYRGMPTGETENGATVYSSARDIGNFAAGFVAGVNGIPYSDARRAFDAYQIYSTNKLAVEGISTQNAERLGWERGYSRASLGAKLTAGAIKAAATLVIARHTSPLLILDLFR